jgi:hypothetical protein
MFENVFWGAALVILIGAAALVAIGATRQPRRRAGRTEPSVVDARRTFGRKRRWRRAAGTGRRPGFFPLR